MSNQHLSNAIKKGSFLFGFLLYLLHKFKKPPFQKGVGGIFLNSATGLLIASILSNSPAQGQSIIAEPSDRTGNTGTRVENNGSQFDIEGGTTSGSNLFHSFDKFGLGSGETANFQTSPSVENILGRVVGGDPSIINGMIQVSGSNANLFLLNPAGIVFGAEASLNIMGDFTASTANGIGFGNSNWFYAIGDNDYTALTGSPSEFVFGSGNGAIINYADLALNAGSNLTLLGSTVLSTGNLTARGGQITVAAVPNSSLVRVGQTGHLLHLDIDTSSAPSIPASNLPAFTPLDLPGLLTDAGTVGNANQVTVNSDGNVVLTGSGLSVQDGDIAVNKVDSSSSTDSGGAIALSANNNLIATGDIDATSTSGTGGEIALEAVANITPGNIATSENNITLSASLVLENDVKFATGSGSGDIIFSSKVDGNSELSLDAGTGNVEFQDALGSSAALNLLDIDAGDVSATSTLNLGGELKINASGAVNLNSIVTTNGNPVNIEASDKITSNGILTTGGDIRLVSTSGAIDTSASLVDSSSASGTGGKIAIEAQEDVKVSYVHSFGTLGGDDISIVSHDGAIDAFSLVSVPQTSGNGGDVTLEAEGNVTLGLGIVTHSQYQGDAGNVSITSHNGDITVTSEISTKAESNGGGQAGNVTLEASNGAISIYGIDADSREAGNQAGDISIQAQGNITASEEISANTRDNAKVGNIEITSTEGNLDIQKIEARIYKENSVANGGSITLEATQGDVRTGQLWTDAYQGDAGSITVTAGGGIFFSDPDPNAGYIYARSRRAGNGGEVTLQAGGDIVTTGSISTNSNRNDGGSISLSSDNGSVTMGSAFTHSSGSGNGGPITITAPSDVEFAELYSGSFFGNGGDITISTGGNITIKPGRLYQYFADNCGGLSGVNIQCNADNSIEITLNGDSSYPALKWLFGNYTGPITFFKLPNNADSKSKTENGNDNSGQTDNSQTDNGQNVSSNGGPTSNSNSNSNSEDIDQTQDNENGDRSNQNSNASQTQDNENGDRSNQNSNASQTQDNENGDRSNENPTLKTESEEDEVTNAYVVKIELKEKESEEPQSNTVTISAQDGEQGEESQATLSALNNENGTTLTLKNNNVPDSDANLPVEYEDFSAISPNWKSENTLEEAIVDPQIITSSIVGGGGDISIEADGNVKTGSISTAPVRIGTGGNVSINSTHGGIHAAQIDTFGKNHSAGDITLNGRGDILVNNRINASSTISGFSPPDLTSTGLPVPQEKQLPYVGQIDSNANGGDISITSTHGSIHVGIDDPNSDFLLRNGIVLPQEIDSSAEKKNAGNILLNSNNNIGIQDIYSTASNVAGSISLASQSGNVNTGDINALGGIRDGAVTISARGINTGTILSDNISIDPATPPAPPSPSSSSIGGSLLPQPIPVAPTPVNVPAPSPAPENLAVNPAPVQVIPEAPVISNPPDFPVEAPPELPKINCPYCSGTDDPLEPPQAIAYSRNITESNIAANPILNIIDPIAALEEGNIENAIQDIEESFTREYANSAGQDYPGVTMNLASIRDTLKSISQENENIKPAVIYAIADPDQLGLIMITAETKTATSTQPTKPNSRSDEELIARVEDFHHNIQDSNTDKSMYLPDARKLYDRLIKPLEAQLEEQGINTLIFSMDEGLRLLPLAALHDGEKFLIEKYNIALIPSVSLMDTSYVGIKNSPVLAMGADKFPHSGQEPLPYVSVELDTITELVSGQTFLNESFTLDGLKDAREQQQFSIVHLATHAAFDPEVSEEQNKDNEKTKDKNYIQFWDERVGLEELREMEWYNHSTVELLVLSACETALGDETAEMGFAGLAVQAGVKSAVASLWKVSDAGTLGLMAEFYQNLNNAPSKAEALRLAQLAMLRGEVRIDDNKLATRDLSIPLQAAKSSKTNNVDLTHPYYWAAFTTIGSPW